MLDKVRELIDRPHCYTVTFKYQSCGSVTCIIKRPYIKHLAVHKVADTEETALKSALELLDKVKFLESKIGTIKAPDLDHQKYEGGHYREILFEDYEVDFKRSYQTYEICDIRRKDQHGFYIVDEPYVLEKHISKLDKDEFYGYNVSDLQLVLGEGEELYFWDNISHLSGSAGLVIVKNGKVIRTKGIAMA